MGNEENEKSHQQLKTTIKENEERLQKLQSTAFSGVILTAICNGATSLRCADRWFLFAVSFLATVLNLVALSTIGLNYLYTKKQEDEN